MAVDAPADELRKFAKASLFGARIVILLAPLTADKKAGLAARRALGSGIS